MEDLGSFNLLITEAAESRGIREPGAIALAGISVVTQLSFTTADEEFGQAFLIPSLRPDDCRKGDIPNKHSVRP